MYGKEKPMRKLWDLKSYLESAIRIAEYFENNFRDNQIKKYARKIQGNCQKSLNCIEKMIPRLFEIEALKFWEKHFEVR